MIAEGFDPYNRSWFRGSPDLRDGHRHWTSSVDMREPPSLLHKIPVGERVWTVPAGLGLHHCVFGSWQEAVHCVDLRTGAESWRLNTRGPIYSSPISLKGGIVVGCEDGELRSIDSNGQLRWSFAAHGGFHATPTVSLAQKLVFAGALDSVLYALNAENGAVAWTAKFSSAEPEHLYSSPALTASDDVILGTDAEVVCLNAEGVERWRFNAGGGIVDATAALCYRTRRGVVGTDEGCCTVFSTETGDILARWSFAGAINNSPAIGQNCDAYFGCDNGTFFRVDLATLEVAWTSEIGHGFRWVPVTCLPTGDPVVVANDEGVLCLSAIDGSVLWCLRPEKGVHSGVALLQSGYLVCGSHHGVVYVYRWPRP